ncbi:MULTISPECIES: hypothetical protein [Pasteurellaceae]|uniref:Uncharacterized protein n=1 Tax=Pasteurella atlantica TaxID=2827233 RepID=A0AAW8CKR0_9PAST|nr:hypothetical protein [Pasteurella atlantica]MBR0574163.1 hypothetical protein [Pasteurella atlantica]MDP8039272.1 hypothetical protein [Pasteurella atlantica]MDP8041364.1 hypothetical protein [Pasteurella atlantica]MDP8043500.1 hypothetical protein [Pasteurella atlantica]MDP8045582.1 hypothetical protein [Pasteurella atlantica]
MNITEFRENTSTRILDMLQTGFNCYDIGHTTEEIADEIGIDIKECKEILRCLVDRKLIRLVHLVDLETNKLMGSGYIPYQR